MTNLNDFDRSLADYLADGPNTAPEAPVIAALAHARTTPRRPDLLRALRPDVMARRRSGGFTLRPGVALAAVALVVASVGVSVIGSRPMDSSIPPGSASVGPTSSPVAGLFSADVPMLVSGGGPLTLRVTDTTGELQSATSLQPNVDGVSIDVITIVIAPHAADPNALVVTWTGTPCEQNETMTVDEAARSISIGREDCQGDSIAVERVLRLGFGGPVNAAAWSGTFVKGAAPSGPAASATTSGLYEPIGSPAVPPVHVALDDEVGDETSVDIVDESGQLVSAVSGPNTSGNGVEAFDATNDSPTTLRLSWPGRPCDTVHRLTIDPTLTTLTLDLPQCRGDLLGVERVLILTFAEEVDAAGLNTQMVPGRGGVDMPTWTAVAPDANGDRYDLTLTDPGYVVDSLEGYFDPERGATGAGPSGIVLDQVDPSIVRVVWAGPACATTFELRLDGPGDTWTLWSAPCEPAGTALRMFDVALRNPRAVETIKFEARVGQPRG